MLIQEKGTIQGSVTVIMHDPEATWGGDTCHAAASHGPGATHQPHVPHNVTFPRLPQQEHRKRRRAEAEEGRGQGKGQQTGIRERKEPGVKQVSAERLRDGSKEWKLVFLKCVLNVK